MKLFLFDIDGTLVNSLGAGSNAFKTAYQDIFQQEMEWQMRQFAGRTDRYICDVSLARIGAKSKENRDKLLGQYVENLKGSIAEKKAIILPGVQEVLQSLRQESDCIIALLTGNIPSGARVKLGELFHLFEFGAFGNEHSDRRLLLDVAHSLFREKYKNMPEDTFVIGDTPFDIECARAGGAKAIAVATGPYPSHELSEADVVLNDLREWDSFWPNSVR